MTVALAATGLLTTACNARTSGFKSVSGTISGADGKIVDVLMGFDAIDAYGRKVDLGGARVGYSEIQRLNHCVPASGAKSSTKCKGTGYVTTKKWSILLPPNVARLYIEVYPKDPTPTYWLNNYRGYTGPAAGTTDVKTYGESYRRDLSTPGTLRNIPIVLPKVCGTPGGTTGSLAGHINGWPYGRTGTVNAWSMAPNTLATQGFATGARVDAFGNYRIDRLQSGQRYGLIAGTTGFSRNVVNLTNSLTNATLIPGACAVKGYNF
ncbi:MAG TPA: hypothetical protein VHX15_13255 [Frankiaceae bacterium]|jgi:hypothetical protein|nr:hypothetical protein [Frankiaceae bacterium]